HKELEAARLLGSLPTTDLSQVEDNVVDVLYSKQRASAMKKERMRLERQEQEVAGCTFQPQLSKSSSKRGSGSGNLSLGRGKAHERLYSLSRVPRQGSSGPSREERELEACTFEPNTHKRGKGKARGKGRVETFGGYGAMLPR
ncbi:hypothetical protein KIPB_016478, partial [Kipferlia bialata]